MIWCIIVWFSTIANSALAVVRGAQETTTGTEASVVSETKPADAAPVFLGGHCVWEDRGASDPSIVDADDFAGAVRNSAAWIRAVLQEQHVPKELEARIAGVVDGRDGYDVTRATWETDRFRFLIRQSSLAIRVVLVAKDQASGETLAKDELEEFLIETLMSVLKHAKAIHFLSQFEEAPFGLKMMHDENLYDENGTPLSYEERKRISELPRAEGSEEHHRLRSLHEARLHEIDPTLPQRFIGGAMNYWWGQVGAATDGCVIVFSAGKGYGGKYETVYLKDWFRKEKLSHPRLKSYGPPMPPKDAPMGTGE